MTLSQLKKDLRAVAQKEKVAIYQNFFKTGPGQYGEGDVFIGVTVPNMRKVAKKHKDLPLSDLQKLLSSKIHEERLMSLYILRMQYEKGGNEKGIVDYYLKNTKRINNWDLVDTSAHYILGDWLMDKDRKILYKFAQSTNLWERRISIMTTFQFIKHKDFEDTLKIADLLLNDEHDLIHKAVGWMIREIGNRDMKVAEAFMKPRYKKMPRTMLRYAIEKYPEIKRKRYLHGKI
jgi:3-methyladenine DNA glycosylase AlkD